MGNKINDTTNYPAVTPEDSDRVLLIDVSDTSDDPNGAVKTALVSDLVDGSDYATAAQGAKADTAVQPADIADFEGTTALNARDTANRSRANHTGAQAQSTITDLITDLAAKAPLASPALTGNPTAPTQTASDNSTKIATTAYVDAASGGGGGGLVPISKTTASNDSAVDIDLTGGYSAYLIQFSSRSSSGTRIMHMRTSSDGGTTFDTGVSDYGWVYHRLSPTASNASDGSDDRIDLGSAMVADGANDIANFEVWVFPRTDSRYTSILSRMAATESGTTCYWSNGSGVRYSTSTVDAVRFFQNLGNIYGDFHLFGRVDGDA